MKKIFAFGLILLLFAGIQSMVPKTAPVDNDVGMSYVLTADDVQPMNITFDNSSPLYFSDYHVMYYADVGTPLCMINVPGTRQEYLWQNNESTLFGTNAKSVKAEGLLCTDTGDLHSQGRVTSRHS